jgi:transcriptional regulator with XRE-family HTH domain
MELSSMLVASMHTLLHTEFAALLARAGVSQAGFARLSGLTPRQVNNWCRGRAAVPPWAAILAAILEERSPDALEMTVDAAQFHWHETLGVPPGAATGDIDGAVRRLACRYAPDQGGTEAQRTRIDAARAQARTTAEKAQAAPPPRL